MALNNSGVEIPISDISEQILQAQKISNIIWAILCFTGLIMGILQLITMAFWKPLRKIEQSMILAIAIGDILKSFSYGAIAIRRLFATITNTDDVGSQYNCMIWLFFLAVSTYVVYLLVVTMSADRLLGLAVPIWYNNQNNKRKLYLIALCGLLGTLIPCGMFFGISNSVNVPVCAYGTSPTEAYRTFASWLENSAAILTLILNVTSCLILVFRWRQATNAHQDMKVFKRTVQFNALKMLMIVASVFLISSALGSFWLMFLNNAGWDKNTVMSYIPMAGAFGLARGVFDFPIYVIMVSDYRMGFIQVICRRKCIGCASAVGAANASASGQWAYRTRENG